MRHADRRSPSSVAPLLLQVSASMGLLLLAPTVTQALPTPPDQGAPTGRQRGGASRGDCVDYQDLTALVPVVDGIVWSQTSSPTPNFFFYVPEALTADMPLELVVQDSEDNYVFRQQFSVDAPPGILRIPVSAENAGLSSGEAYLWTFSIYCDAARPSSSVSVFGTIQRVDDTGVVEGDRPLPPDQQLDLAQQYAETGLWHEALALTLSLYPTDSDEAEYLEMLESLLETAGISDIAPTVPVREVPE
uniref:DUF928 domain-containing protein n=1 Tax=Lyngbya confervoides BDU141951 TaxID=1574623 RepID=A0A8T6QUB0_9CYAN